MYKTHIYIYDLLPHCTIVCKLLLVHAPSSSTWPEKKKSIFICTHCAHGWGELPEVHCKIIFFPGLTGKHDKFKKIRTVGTAWLHRKALVLQEFLLCFLLACPGCYGTRHWKWMKAAPCASSTCQSWPGIIKDFRISFYSCTILLTVISVHAV